MPRYAKKSVEHAIYRDLQNEHREEKRGKVPEKRGKSLRSLNKVAEIKALCRMHDNGWVTDESFLSIVGEIVRD